MCYVIITYCNFNNKYLPNNDHPSPINLSITFSLMNSGTTVATLHCFLPLNFSVWSILKSQNQGSQNCTGLYSQPHNWAQGHRGITLQRCNPYPKINGGLTGKLRELSGQVCGCTFHWQSICSVAYHHMFFQDDKIKQTSNPKTLVGQGEGQLFYPLS